MVRIVKLFFSIPTGPLPPPDTICNEVVEMINAGAEEPLGHQLFREAWSERERHPRSALVIGVAAAEVGFKKLVGGLVPQAQWLMDEVQTPSLAKMLRKFLPTLPVKFRFQGKSIRPPNVLLNKLDRAIEYRNKLVHAGQPPPGRSDLEECFAPSAIFSGSAMSMPARGGPMSTYQPRPEWLGQPSLSPRQG
jgi:hypothetical protein